MSIQKPQDLFTIQQGDLITKRNLYDLIQYSKIEGSEFYGGKNVSIGNTPQQGINWIGSPPDTVGVIIKTRPGSYEHDGWVDGNKDLYRYSFKARNGNISYKEKANDVLIKQPQHLYPILLFTESEKSWLFEGTFELKAIMESFVILQRIRIEIEVKESTPKEPDDQIYQEGDRRYVTHLMIERNSKVVTEIKAIKTWICEICSLDFEEKYGFPYIEAHHKKPISTYTDNYLIFAKDLALLCPNCHKAVHIHMKHSDISYDEIKEKLSGNI